MSAYPQQVVKLTRLRAVREAQFLSQDEVARKAGITVSTLSRIENGLQEPYGSTVRKIARALKVKPQDLVGDDNG